jgi:hypothetical protein
MARRSRGFRRPERRSGDRKGACGAGCGGADGSGGCATRLLGGLTASTLSECRCISDLATPHWFQICRMPYRTKFRSNVSAHGKSSMIHCLGNVSAGPMRSGFRRTTFYFRFLKVLLPADATRSCVIRTRHRTKGLSYRLWDGCPLAAWTRGCWIPATGTGMTEGR